jgi:hypothetical protein
LVAGLAKAHSLNVPLCWIWLSDLACIIDAADVEGGVRPMGLTP